MRNRLAIALAFLLMVPACGGGTGATTSATTTVTSTVATTTTSGPTTTTTQPGFEVVSEDGDFTLEVPFEAMASDPGITIRPLDGDEYPPELAGAAENPDSRIYELEPDGTVFAAPVTVTRRIDASRFGDLGPDEVPIVVLITYNDDGTYEPLGDLRVLRNGDDVFVSGTMTHFSPAIAVSMQAKAKLGLDDLHLGFGTELGTSLELSYSYATLDGAELAAPAVTQPVGFSRSIITSFYDLAAQGKLGVMCDKIGEANPRLGVSVTLDAEPAEGQLGLSPSILGLMGFLEQLVVLLKVVESFECFDPATAFVGFALTGLSVQTDHPGGEVVVPGEAWNGGRSGGYIQLNPAPQFGLFGGLIRDANHNDMVDPTDEMYAPWQFTVAGGIASYTAPLNSYDRYFIYLGRRDLFSGMPSGSEWTIAEALPAFNGLYTGTGRFETSIGIVGTGASPFVYEVNDSEAKETLDDALVLQLMVRF